MLSHVLLFVIIDIYKKWTLKGTVEIAIYFSRNFQVKKLHISKQEAYISTKARKSICHIMKTSKSNKYMSMYSPFIQERILQWSPRLLNNLNRLQVCATLPFQSAKQHKLIKKEARKKEKIINNWLLKKIVKGKLKKDQGTQDRYV